MKQAILTAPETIEFSEISNPDIMPHQILIKVKNIGICGSDIHAYYGKHPFMSFPIRLGHEMAGEVMEFGSQVTGYEVGDLVTIMPQEFCHECEPCQQGRYNICNTLDVIGCQTPGAACEYFSVDAALVKKIPLGMSAEMAATIEPAAVGVHAVRQGTSVKGKNVVVMGAGTIGNVTAQAAMAEGAKSVLITDLSEYRLELAKKCGIPYGANTGKKSMKEAIADSFGSEGADIFFECIGIGSAVNQAIECSKKGHDIIIVGVYGTTPEINMAWVQDREFRLIGSLMYVEKDFQDTIDYMAVKKINMEPLISKVFSFDEYAEAFHYIEENKDTSLKVLIEM
ncbi:L-iditol 2-dehydrogenase [Aequitasia blattaphilus]|uniref:Alcohol dehydrogenase catalytic domain-containing protein n=1 Tax=Aequitasia blattaphilus TaxID=2949332 RepID=A0ABT1E548_9FIRM|nr:alcohol dehydrogenase catalytic domain-containing protein [Aequitasia blattaphilus]MCP1100962.1 alcohol dehydrogenase catalytic domain-containing protein [Aequitasia blattaphilus]MCR8613602.1 alcohol dehydrogenase catalytic domain-containing protein [Aequitasia blattaphilus]